MPREAELGSPADETTVDTGVDLHVTTPMPPKPSSPRSLVIVICILALHHLVSAATPLGPLLAAHKPVDWWFVFKFNAATFPGDESMEPAPTIFGGTPTNYHGGFCLAYAYASSADSTLRMGTNYIGLSLNDPLGATFDQIYHGTCIMFCGMINSMMIRCP